mmetsp:Transcript_7367/g.23552  ORF Transcript_7367/g.23552 Transcript_7367/m.23552 type:complete len:492 (-) Transcript_7367:160-1635(-)
MRPPQSSTRPSRPTSFVAVVPPVRLSTSQPASSSSTRVARNMRTSPTDACTKINSPESRVVSTPPPNVVVPHTPPDTGPGMHTSAWAQKKASRMMCVRSSTSRVPDSAATRSSMSTTLRTKEATATRAASAAAIPQPHPSATASTRRPAEICAAVASATGSPLRCSPRPTFGYVEMDRAATASLSPRRMVDVPYGWGPDSMRRTPPSRAYSGSVSGMERQRPRKVESISRAGARNAARTMTRPSLVCAPDALRKAKLWYTLPLPDRARAQPDRDGGDAWPSRSESDWCLRVEAKTPRPRRKEDEPGDWDRGDTDTAGEGAVMFVAPLVDPLDKERVRMGEVTSSMKTRGERMYDSDSSRSSDSSTLPRSDKPSDRSGGCRSGPKPPLNERSRHRPSVSSVSRPLFASSSRTRLLFRDARPATKFENFLRTGESRRDSEENDPSAEVPSSVAAVGGEVPLGARSASLSPAPMPFWMPARTAPLASLVITKAP